MLRLARRTLPASRRLLLTLSIACLAATLAVPASKAFEPREIEVTRLDAAETQGLGWDPAALDRLVRYVTTLSADSFMIVTEGELVAAVGALDELHSLHSLRKALLSAVIGQHLGSGPGEIALEATLEELGIDDAPQPLTQLQKQATVQDLLRSRSGINHPAAAGGGLTADKDRRLGKEENEPGKIWAYNNWDYNALTTIFEQVTGLTVAEAFASAIAGPIGLQDFSADHVSYIRSPELSRHGAAMFAMSARDLARFGQLYLDRGLVGDKAVLPAAWVDRITEDYSETGLGGLRSGHGYLWWFPGPETGLPPGSFFGWGLGQQSLFVLPQWQTVIVYQSDTTQFLERWLALQEKGVGGDAAAEEIVLSCFSPEAAKTEYCREDRFTTGREIEKLIALLAAARL